MGCPDPGHPISASQHVADHDSKKRHGKTRHARPDEAFELLAARIGRTKNHTLARIDGAQRRLSTERPHDDALNKTQR